MSMKNSNDTNQNQTCDLSALGAAPQLRHRVPLEKKTVKRSVQCHVFAQSLPDQHPNDKHPVNITHRSRFV
jgi:hypothetical protein